MYLAIDFRLDQRVINMEYELIQTIIKTLIPMVILISLLLAGYWQILLGISILIVSSGFFGMNTFMELDAAGTLSESSLYGTLELSIANFLKAIFVLLLAIFTWLRKESISIKPTHTNKE